MWNDLTMSERASVIKMAVKAGLRDMKSIRDFYDNSLKYADGGSINISPSKRGTFTAAATKHGMGVQEFASKVLANKDNYSPAMVKKANFAKNASKWKHCLGGYLFEEGGPKVTYGKPYYSYDKNMQIETDNGKPILNYSATLPEVNIIPDSKKSPADRNEARRFREKVFSDNAEREARDYTQRQIMKSQRDWDNSLEKKALGYAQNFMTGVGIGADIVSGLPIYSSLKGSRVLSEANSLPEYVEGGLWLAPIGGVVGKEVYNVGKNVWNTSKNAIKNTIGNIGKNNKTTPVDFNNLTPEQWTAFQDKAIAEGDMAEAQRLRDLHFQVSAPDTKIDVPLWTSSEEAFNSFDLSHFGETDSGFFGYGHYLTPIEKYAATYHPINRRFYVNMENPYIGNNDQYFNRIQYVKDRLAKRKENIMHNLRDGKLTRFSKKLGINENTSLEEAEHLVDKYIKDETVKWNNKYVKYADEFKGKDGVLSWRELQGVPNKQEGIYKEVVVPKGEQIKSADAITYDDNGVRIPLGLRDNFRSKDIRYGLIPLIGGASLSNQYAEGGPKVTLVDSDKVRMNDSGIFSDDNGNIIGDSVVLPEISVRPTTPQTNNSSYYQQWLMRQADRGGRNMSLSDREAYDRMMSRAANQNEVKNFTGFDGTIYKHGNGALEQVSPEFDALTLGRQFYTDGLSDIIGNVGKNALKKAHIGNYYIKPQYNDYSYIRQVGDDAVEDMIRTNQMRSSLAIEREQRPWNELGILLGHEPEELSRMIPDGKGSMTIPFKYRLNNHKVFEDQMYYTGRPFYGDVRTNYIVTKPRPLTDRKSLVNKGLEWIESNHKNHTGAAKALAKEKGIDPNTTPGRIVVPLWNGDKNVIPVDALGKFDLYRPVKLGNINMPFYRKYSINSAK